MSYNLNENDRKEQMISTKYIKKPFTRSTLFCDRPFDIENYDRARLDDVSWVCHHRLECNNGVQQYTSEQLKQLGLYYHQPAESLIFLPYWFHHKMHAICRMATETNSFRIFVRITDTSTYHQRNCGNKYPNQTGNQLMATILGLHCHNDTFTLFCHLDKI